MRVARFGLLLAGLFGSAQIATAADMPLKAAPAPVLSWTGLYAGVHSGWGWTSGGSNSALTAIGAPPASVLTSAHDLSTDGPTFGAHIGYNWQVTPRSWVLGIEGDITGAGLNGTSAVTPTCPSPFCGAGVAVPGAVVAMQREVNWLASVRGRVGYTLDQGLWGYFAPGMVYVTGGAAWASIDYKANTGDSFFSCGGPCSYPASLSTTKSGWTIGGGYEAVLAQNWLVRLEYLYYSFDGDRIAAAAVPATPFTGTTYSFGDLNIHTVRAGLSYKFGAPVAAGAYGQAAPTLVAGWTGFYLGTHAGWGWTSGATQSAVTTVTPAPNVALLWGSQDASTNGPLRGSHLGYNWQLNPAWVVGIEGDFTSANLKSTSTAAGFCPAPFCAAPGVAVPNALMVMQREVNWLASLRGRLGYTWGPSMLYLTGGVAWADVDYTATAGDAFLTCGATATGCAFPASLSTTKSGWTLGGGYETALVGKWLVRLEYLYYRFGGDTIVGAPTSAAGCIASGFITCSTTYTFSDLEIHTLRAGLTYKF